MIEWDEIVPATSPGHCFNALLHSITRLANNPSEKNHAQWRQTPIQLEQECIYTD
jgi:hypothetical protein